MTLTAFYKAKLCKEDVRAYLRLVNEFTRDLVEALEKPNPEEDLRKLYIGYFGEDQIFNPDTEKFIPLEKANIGILISATLKAIGIATLVVEGGYCADREMA